MSESVAGLTVLLSVLILLALAALIYMRAQSGRHAIRRATTDELTGLYDISTGEKMMRVMLSHIGRGKLVMAMLDIDDVSQLRDACGDEVCDAMVRGAAKRLASEISGRGNLCHVMNDTFLIALPFDGEAAEALERVDRLRQLMGGTILDLQRGRRDVRASAGAAICPVNGRGYAELYEKADMALFWSKRDGKDRTTLYRESDEAGREPLRNAG